MLERLMNEQAIYQKGHKEPDCYDPQYITKLLLNYRSHPAIMQIPNEMFYDNELVAMADLQERNSLSEWSGLPTSGFPVMFQGVLGKEEREENR